MQDFKALATALGDRLKANFKRQNVDVNRAASRYVAERVLAHWHDVFGPSPFVVHGGLMFPQAMRPTEDGDIVVVRRFSETELQNGFARMTALLRLEGIELRKIKIQQIEVGTGQPVTRVKIEAMCGTLRGNTHLDIAVATGPHALPKGIVKQELPSMVRGEPGLVAHVQPLPASAAEKWFAVLQQEPTDYRVKHAMDLLSFDEMGVSPALVSVEMIRIARHRGLSMSVCAPAPRNLEWPSFVLRAEAWLKTGAERGVSVDPLAAREMLGSYWARTHQALTRAVIAEARDRDYQPALVDRIAARQQPTPAFRPTP
ncbi:nucleotidyl transferase AbiEii/AbiGii toxin family protein [uncultured Agrobacterium sp.]|uniref:nucleotidyl transferase AbiEii/AbiGii toxin family protein n=1 Tax=uncultured Agrobacterium sp. TaxID=157277 RepID=UPI0025F74289|nr:nucleotidyl transferase AbiEii/AbiGii toxin family protein [uncultured Agrobacterium sp.]